MTSICLTQERTCPSDRLPSPLLPPQRLCGWGFPQSTSEPEGKAGNQKTQENFGGRGCAGQALSRVQEKAALLPVPVVSAEPPRSLQGLEYRMQATRGAGTGGHGKPRAGPSQEGLGLLLWEEGVGQQ